MFPFDRLIRAMDELKQAGLLDDEVLAQIGDGQYEPTGFPFLRMMEKQAFEEQLARCELVISHAGIGTIATALRFYKPMVALPRRAALAEHVNDHQVGTGHRYAELGHLILADQVDQLPSAIATARAFKPLPRVPHATGIADRIGAFLRSI